jgi:hypothetical protein
MKLDEGKGPLRVSVVTFMAAWAFRMGIAYVTHRWHDFPRQDMNRVALHFLQTGVIGDIFSTPTGPTAMLPPAYILILAAIYRFFGTGVAAEFVKVLTCTMVVSLRCALVPWLASRMKLGNAVVVISAVLSTLWIGAFETELHGDWDAPYTALFLLLLTYMHYALPLANARPRRAALFGLAWGFAALFNPGILSTLAGFLLLEFWWMGRFQFPRYCRQAVILTACLMLVLFPWALRNKEALGGWVWTRSGLGFELALSYHTGAHWSDRANLRPSVLHPGQPNRDSEISVHPWLNPHESMRVAQLGELAWNQQLMHRGIDWILANPRESAILAAQHTFYFWFPPGAGFYEPIYRTTGLAAMLMLPYPLAKYCLTILAFAGLFLGWRRNPRAMALFGVELLLFPLIYYLIDWSSRYRTPIESVLVLLAAVPLAAVWEHWHARTP